MSYIDIAVGEFARLGDMTACALICDASPRSPLSVLK